MLRRGSDPAEWLTIAVVRHLAIGAECRLILNNAGLRQGDRHHVSKKPAKDCRVPGQRVESKFTVGCGSSRGVDIVSEAIAWKARTRRCGVHTAVMANRHDGEYSGLRQLAEVVHA